MPQRLNFFQQSQELTRKLVAFGPLFQNTTIEQSIREFVEIRASQLNGCAFRVDMHIKQAKSHGKRERRLHHVATRPIWSDAMKTVESIAATMLVSWLLVAQPAAAAPEANVTPLLNEALPEYPGKEAEMIIVDYPPGAVDPVHRHDAHAFVYVLEGSIVMGVKGGKEVTLKAGETFHERPNDIHTVGRNASNTQPARFVVLLLKKKGAPIFMPVK